LSVASTMNQSRRTSSGFAEKVFMGDIPVSTQPWVPGLRPERTKIHRILWSLCLGDFEPEIIGKSELCVKPASG
jgi:hypothetical protein